MDIEAFMADVLWTFHRDSVFLPGTATGVPRRPTRFDTAGCSGILPIGTADLLAFPSSLRECLDVS